MNILLVAALIFFSTSAVVNALPTPSSRTYALIVGVNYSGAASGRYSSEQEAQILFQVLTDPEIGLATKATSKLVLHPTKAMAMQAIDEYSSKLLPGDTLIFFWAGRMRTDPGIFSFPGRASGDEVMLEPADGDSSGSPEDRNPILNGIPTGYQDNKSIPVSSLLLATERAQANLILITESSSLGPNFSSRTEHASRRLGILSATRPDEQALGSSGRSLFSVVFQEALRDPGTDRNGDGRISVKEAFDAIYSRMEAISGGIQVPSIAGPFVDQLWLARSPGPSTALKFATDIPEDIRSADKILVNDEEVTVDHNRSGPRELVLLGRHNSMIDKGLAILSTAKKDVQQLFYAEGGSLERFTNPYSSSAAIIVAIDDYERINDPLHRGGTGYESRAFMVQRAEEFKAALMHLGFPEKSIITLYNDKATSSAIDSSLKSFWLGGGRVADRLIFYFGGHGDTFDGTGVLITYDFDKTRPTLSGFLMKDLATRHAENIASRHVLFAIDACAAGLATYLGKGIPPVPPRVNTLSVIRNDTAEKARNMFVAGIEARPALWDKGGIFTQALIEGLQGKADTNNDGIIQFSELDTYVSDRVAGWAESLAAGAQQHSKARILDKYGEGKIVFLRRTP